MAAPGRCRWMRGVLLSDVARMLARAQVVHRIQASRDWSTVLTDLGLGDPKHGMGVHDEQAVRDALISLDSVKRKRRKKMNKHKCVSLSPSCPSYFG